MPAKGRKIGPTQAVRLLGSGTGVSLFKGKVSDGTIPLRGPGAYLALRDGMVDVHIPYLFGSTPISVPLAGLGVNDPRLEAARRGAASPQFVARTPMRIVPPARFPVTFKTWNTVLMFRTPIDLPRPRGFAVWLWPMFNRRRRGIYGLFVTAADASMARSTLAEWGVELVDDSRKWTQRHWRAA